MSLTVGVPSICFSQSNAEQAVQFNAVVDVVIGLVVLFWMVATSSSFIVEAIVSAINIRGKVLGLYVREMIMGGQAVQALRGKLTWFSEPLIPERDGAPASMSVALDAAALNVLDHPLIRRLSKPSARLAGNDTAPSYIPSELFAKALIDRLRQVYGGLLTMREVAIALRPHFPAAAAQGLSLTNWQVDFTAGRSILINLLSQIAATPGAQFGLYAAQNSLLPGSAAARVLKVLRDHINAGPIVVATLLQEVDAIVANRGALSIGDLQSIATGGRLPPSLAAAIKPLLDSANHDIEAFRQQLAGWYDSVMDRASGWFRRYSQLWLFGVALVLAVAMNLDAIYIGQHLVSDRAARDAAVRVGQTIVDEGKTTDAWPQKFEFVQRYQDGKWAEPLLSVENRAEATRVAASELQPLLLVSGSYAGPLLALQGAVLSMDRRCPEGATPCSSEAAFMNEWAELKDQRIALAAALCRQTAKAAGGVKRERTAALSNDQLLADWKNQCPDLPMIADAQVATAEDARKVLLDWWQQRQISWSKQLSTVSVEALYRTNITANQETRTQEFHAAVQAALETTGRQLQSADDLLARLPYVGSTKGFFQRWLDSNQERYSWQWCWGVLLNICGWLVTALMASLGAPTWFDLLNKLVNRRIAGPKPGTAAALGAD